METNLSTPVKPQPPGPLEGLGVTVVVVSALIGWIALGTVFLSEASLFGGFLILLYWAKIEQFSLSGLAAAILGALVGIGISWSTYYGATHYGGVGFAVGMALLIVAIYLDIIERFPLFVNTSTILFSIITAAPLVQLKVNWVELCLATVGGGLFFAAFVMLAHWLVSKLPKSKTSLKN